MTTANVILNQLGGNKFIAMTNAKCFSDNEDQTLVVKFKGSRIANIMTITLNSLDLYDVKISKYTAKGVKIISELNNAYHDMLNNFFEKTTGLYTKL